MKLDLSTFWARVERLQPGVTRRFFNRRLQGERFEQAEERNALEYQVQSLLNGIATELEDVRNSNEEPAPSAALTQRLEITEQAFLLLGSEPPEHLRDPFECPMKTLTGKRLDQRILLISRGVANAYAENPASTLSEQLQRSVEQLDEAVNG